MKKVLLAGTALAAAFIATPASAQLELGLAGFFREYAVYSDDQSDGASLRQFDLRRDTEVHFTGETTLDNGLTVGVHQEFELGGNVDAEESYAYFSGSWGRVNVGQEDGAAYLLQVAAPSADSNVDGLRTYIQAVDLTDTLEYDHADFQEVDRVTYLTPKFNGFQAGVSYAFDQGTDGAEYQQGDPDSPMERDDNADQFQNLIELAARWDGEYNGLGIALGAGFSNAELESRTGATRFGDGIMTWNVGGAVTWNAFSLGGSYQRNETEDITGDDVDVDTYVIGAAWDNGPYHVGASYIDSDSDNADVLGVDAKRFTVGAGYTFGPGMSFRGAVAFGEGDQSVGTGTEEDFTQVTLGTDIDF